MIFIQKITVQIYAFFFIKCIIFYIFCKYKKNSNFYIKIAGDSKQTLNVSNQLEEKAPHLDSHFKKENFNGLHNFYDRNDNISNTKYCFHHCTTQKAQQSTCCRTQGFIQIGTIQQFPY